MFMVPSYQTHNVASMQLGHLIVIKQLFTLQVLEVEKVARVRKRTREGRMLRTPQKLTLNL
jgi:hypothetical protein